MGLRWEEERYVKFFTRDTPEFKAMSWQARGLLGLLMRKVDPAGILPVGRLGLRGVAVAVEGPWEEIEPHLKELLDDGCVVFNEERQTVLLPNFMKAQETPQSDAARKRASRERARAEATPPPSRPVTFGHAESQTVTPRPEQTINERSARGREEQEECQNAAGEGNDFGGDNGNQGRPPREDYPIHQQGPSLGRGGGSAESGGNRRASGEESPERNRQAVLALEQGDDADRIRPPARTGQEPIVLTSKRALPTPDDPEDLLGVLARLAGAGQPWALEVEQWRQANPGRALTEGQRRVLRKERDKIQSAARPILTTQDELNIQAMVAAYVEAQRRVLRDKAFVALDTHYRDAKAILGDTRRLAERAKRGEWRPTPAEVVAHKCRAYMANPRNAPFALRFLLDRTEQDDLPVPPRPRPQKLGPDPPPAPPPTEAFDIAKGNFPPLSSDEQKDLDELKGRLSGETLVNKKT